MRENERGGKMTMSSWITGMYLFLDYLFWLIYLFGLFVGCASLILYCLVAGKMVERGNKTKFWTTYLKGNNL